MTGFFRYLHFIKSLKVFRLNILLVFFIPLFFTLLCAQKPDSADLFSQLSTADSHKKLNILQQIYSDYWAFYPIKGYPYMLQSLALAQKLNDKKAEVMAYYSLSFYYSCRGLTDSASYFCQVGAGSVQAVKFFQG